MGTSSKLTPTRLTTKLRRGSGATGGEAREALAIESSTHRDGRRVLRVSGELDAYNASRLRHVLRDDSLSGATLYLDLAGLTFLDGAGLGSVEWAHRRQRARGGRLVLLPGRREVHRYFELAGLDTRLEFAPPEDRPELAGQRSSIARAGPPSPPLILRGRHTSV